ncbi:carbohydrate ABC transporter permease [Spirillospora sp. CA-294931]|uniref:carbohydrate ABC transporter permease n=1 Tax=Spirillospora sp. CA-294931 TaxID=3240042 RepID=UPI003D8CC57A
MTTLRRLTVLVLVVFAGFPLYWMLVTALSGDRELFRKPPRAVPDPGQAGNLGEAVSGGVPLDRWLLNSTVIAAGTTVLSLAMAVLAAYAISRFRFRGRGLAGLAMFVTQMLPEALLVVPLYTLFLGFGLLNSLTGLVLANTAFAMPVAVWIIKGAMDAVPHELEEAARVDGCPKYAILGQVVLPLVAPSVAAAGIITFFTAWNEYLFAVKFLTDESKWPASVGLASFIGEFVTPLNLVMSAALVFSVPAVAFFLLVQRRIVGGLTAGAVKG